MAALATVIVCVLGFISYVGVMAFQQPTRGFSWSVATGQVAEVDPEAFAAQAGLRSGDVIKAFNSIPLAMLDQRVPQPKPGDVVELQVVRGAEQLTLRFQVAAPNAFDLFRRFVSLLVGLGFGLLGCYVWMARPHDRVASLFLLVSQLWAAVLAGATLSNLVFIGGVLFNQVLHTCFALLAAVFLHFHMLFPRQKGVAIRPRLIITLYTLALVLVLAIWIVPLSGATPNNWLFMLLSNASQFYLSGAIIVAMFLIGHTFATTESPLERRASVGASILVLTPLISLVVMPDVVNSAGVIAYEMALLLLLVMPLSYAAAIHHARLRRINQVVNRGVVHLTLLLMLVLVYLLITGRLSLVWSQMVTNQPIAWGGITLIMAVAFVLLSNWLQRSMDRLFYGGWYNYHTVVGEISRLLSGNLNRELLAQVLVNRLTELLHVRDAVLLLSGHDGTLEVVRSTEHVSTMAGMSGLPVSGAVGNALLQTAAPLSHKELCALVATAALSNAEQHWLADDRLALWIPLVHQGQLLGILMLGLRADAEPFDAEDRSVLASLAWEAGIAIKNVQLVGALQQRAYDVEQLYKQLVQSREAERRRLARELHDQVIQSLVSLHYTIAPGSPWYRGAGHTINSGIGVEIQAIIGQLRQVCSELRPMALDDLSLSLAIRGYVAEVSERYQMTINLHIPDAVSAVMDKLPEDISICLFRVLQEALTNIHRHADAQQAWVHFRATDTTVELEVRDNGRGFCCPPRLESLVKSKHFGLVGLHERVKLLGGQLQITSAPGKGTVLLICVPVVVAFPLLQGEDTLFDRV